MRSVFSKHDIIKDLCYYKEMSWKRERRELTYLGSCFNNKNLKSANKTLNHFNWKQVLESQGLFCCTGCNCILLSKTPGWTKLPVSANEQMRIFKTGQLKSHRVCLYRKAASLTLTNNTALFLTCWNCSFTMQFSCKPLLTAQWTPA